MLVLSRKLDEKIIMEPKEGVLIEIMVVELQGDRVKLGITAPKEIPVHREEIYKDIKLNGPRTKKVL